MNEIDWEERAHELAFEAGEKCDHCPKAGCDRLLVNTNPIKAALMRFAREVADARAKEIAKAIEDANVHVYSKTLDGTAIQLGVSEATETHAMIARSFISKKKTREEVLEEALREIVSLKIDYANPPEGRSMFIARRALEWKDTDRHP